MRPSRQSSSYIIRNQYSYCFRMVVPKDLRKFVRKTELRYTLNTGSIGLARSKARLLAGQVQEFFRKLREIIKLGELTDEQIQEMVNNFFRVLIDNLENGRVEAGHIGKKDVIDFSYKIFQSECNRAQRDLREYYHQGVSGMVDHMLKREQYVNQMLKGEVIEVEKDTITYDKICREFLKALIKFGKIDENRHKGIYSDDVRVSFPMSSDKNAEMLPSADPKKENSIPLGKLIDEFKNGKIKSGKWSANTARNHQAKINLLLQALGNRPVNLITVEDLRNLAKLLEFLPPGFALMKAYKNISGLSADDLKGKHKDTLDVTTRRDYLNFIKSVFTFAKENEYITKNPVISGLIPDKKKQTRHQRSKFDDPKDLMKIFNPDTYLKWSDKEPSRFWLPLLALYTGCRVEETASLYCEHVKKVEGLWCIEINDDYDRKVKNDNAIRTIPLHPILVEEFKFPKYVKRMKAQGNVRIFPELKMGNHKYSHSFSKKFGRYLRNKAKINDPKKVFHSFRHTVSDHLYKELVPESLIEELTGRAGKTETTKRYTKGYRVKTLNEEGILKLRYKVDLSQLKESNHVIK